MLCDPLTQPMVQLSMHQQPSLLFLPSWSKESGHENYGFRDELYSYMRLNLSWVFLDSRDSKRQCRHGRGYQWHKDVDVGICLASLKVPQGLIL